jgi:hypothetical protein
MNLNGKLTIVFLVAGLATVSAVLAQEKKIKREDLPPAVEWHQAGAGRPPRHSRKTPSANGKRPWDEFGIPHTGRRRFPFRLEAIAKPPFCPSKPLILKGQREVLQPVLEDMGGRSERFVRNLPFRRPH